MDEEKREEFLAKKQNEFSNKNRIKRNFEIGAIFLILLYLLSVLEIPSLNKSYLIGTAKYSGIIIGIGIYVYLKLLKQSKKTPAFLIDLLEITLIIFILSLLTAFFGIKALIFLLSISYIYKYKKNKYRNVKTNNNLENHREFNKYINIEQQRSNNKEMIDLLKRKYRRKEEKELKEESLGIKFNIKELKNEFNRNSTVTLGLVSVVVTMYLFILEPFAEDGSQVSLYIILFVIVIVVLLVAALLRTTFKLSKKKTIYEIVDTVLDDIINEKMYKNNNKKIQ